LKKVVEAAGLTPDMSKIKSLAAALAEVNIGVVELGIHLCRTTASQGGQES
jgi:ribosomal protein L12E/L44/L45/RPP1/RPP2